MADSRLRWRMLWTVPLCIGIFVVRGLAGCAAPVVPEDAWSPTIDDETSPDELRATPSLTAEDVAAAVNHVFAVSLPDVWQVHDTYLSLLAAGDTAPTECPGSTTVLTGEGVPRSGCTSSTGYDYLGVSTYSSGYSVDEAGVETLEFFMDGDYEINTPAEIAFEVGGRAGYQRIGTPTSWHAETIIAGTWRLDGASGALGAGISASLSVQGQIRPTRADVFLRGAAAAGSDSVQFEDVILDLVDCDGRPEGIIRVREPTGYWYTVVLEDDCSGCGEGTFFDGTSVGEVCIPLEGVAAGVLADIGRWE